MNNYKNISNGNKNNKIITKEFLYEIEDDNDKNQIKNQKQIENHDKQGKEIIKEDKQNLISLKKDSKNLNKEIKNNNEKIENEKESNNMDKELKTLKNKNIKNGETKILEMKDNKQNNKVIDKEEAERLRIRREQEAQLQQQQEAERLRIRREQEEKEEAERLRIRREQEAQLQQQQEAERLRIRREQEEKEEAERLRIKQKQEEQEESQRILIKRRKRKEQEDKLEQEEKEEAEHSRIQSESSQNHLLIKNLKAKPKVKKLSNVITTDKKHISSKNYDLDVITKIKSSNSQSEKNSVIKFKKKTYEKSPISNNFNQDLSNIELTKSKDQSKSPLNKSIKNNESRYHTRSHSPINYSARKTMCFGASSGGGQMQKDSDSMLHDQMQKIKRKQVDRKEMTISAQDTLKYMNSNKKLVKNKQIPTPKSVRDMVQGTSNDKMSINRQRYLNDKSGNENAFKLEKETNKLMDTIKQISNISQIINI